MRKVTNLFGHVIFSGVLLAPASIYHHVTMVTRLSESYRSSIMLSDSPATCYKFHCYC